MKTRLKEKADLAREMMDDFISRTGINNPDNKDGQRYLWTDAFAVQSLIGLAHVTHSDMYRDRALNLIHEVHHTLGRHRHDDSREGWISGLSDAEGEKRPTVNGLRIGKDLPERRRDEQFNDRVEWDRDGQYFHYITRWIHSLLQASLETSDHRFAEWAADLTKATEKFVDKSDNRTKMYWKMSIDLSHPLVQSMGAHDPLEGLICLESILYAVPGRDSELRVFRTDLESLCDILDWFTTDALGIGGLLLNTVKACELTAKNRNLHPSVSPRQIWRDSVQSLKAFTDHVYARGAPATTRLGFRECGLSLGIRVLAGIRERYSKIKMDFDEIDRFVQLADEIEDFWSMKSNREVKTWIGHLNINEVMLASSIIAGEYPYAFGGIPFRG